MSLTYRRPETLSQAFGDLTEGALVLAGGQSLVLLMNTGLLYPSRLVSIAGIDELHGIHLDGDALDIGAMSTHAQIAGDPLVREHLPVAVSAFAQVGNARVRAAGTVGGNLVHADPAQDPPVVLAALAAQVTVASRDTDTRILSSSDIAIGPMSAALEEDEILTRVRVPIPGADTRCSYIKFQSGSLDDYATVSVAARVTFAPDGSVRDARLAGGAVGPTVTLFGAAAELLRGHRLEDEDVLDEVARVARETVSPTADRRGTADYKRAMTGVIVTRALRQCLQDRSGARRPPEVER